MNFIYTIDPTAEEPIMLINKHIGFDQVDGMGIMGDQFQMELMTLDSMGKRRVEVWIISEGGSVLDGEKIYSAILHAKCKVDTYCMGMAASIAAVIFQAGRRRIIADFGKLMYHPVSGALPSEMAVFNEAIATMVCERTGSTKEEVLAMMAKTTWMLADEAVKAGFADETLSSGDANKGRLTKLSNIKEYNKVASLIMNKALDDKKQTVLKFQTPKNMSKVANILNLNSEASDEAIVAEVTKLRNKAEAAEEEAKNAKSDFEKKEEEMKKAKAEFDALKEEFDKMKSAKDEVEKNAKDKEEEAAKEKAKNLVKIHTDRKAISNKAEVVEMWVEDAVANYEKTKTKLEAIPVNNKDYVSIENSAKAGDQGNGGAQVDNRRSASSAAVLQAQVINSNKKK